VRFIGILLVGFLPFILGGCAGKLKALTAGSLIRDVAAATAKHDDIDLAIEGAPTYLLLLEGLLESNPTNTTLLSATAEAYVAYGTLIEADNPDRSSRLYKRAHTYARLSLEGEKAISRKLNTPYLDFVTVASELKHKHLERVFWLASSWGAWISLNTHSMQALADLPKVIYLMEWVIKTDETFYYGSPHIFLGVYHSALPPMLGGSPEKSKSHFDSALTLSQGRMLMIKVQMARFYARQIFDRQLYTSLLEQVIEADPHAGDLTLQNVAAQRLARKLLEETDEYF
jgi:hypothetical protein